MCARLTTRCPHSSCTRGAANPCTSTGSARRGHDDNCMNFGTSQHLITRHNIREITEFYLWSPLLQTLFYSLSPSPTRSLSSSSALLNYSASTVESFFHPLFFLLQQNNALRRPPGCACVALLQEGLHCGKESVHGHLLRLCQAVCWPHVPPSARLTVRQAQQPEPVGS